MAALELHDIEGPVLKENITKAIQGLEQPLQKVLSTHVTTDTFNQATRGFVVLCLDTSLRVMLHGTILVLHSISMLEQC